MLERNISLVDSWPESSTLKFDMELPVVRVDDFDSGSPEKLLQWQYERSPRLNADPSAILSTSEEVNWYRLRLRKVGADGKYLEAIDTIIDQTPLLRDISPDTKALLCMPVAALSEYDSIFGALSLYAQQDPTDLADTTILVHVNWTESALNQSDKIKKLTQALSEIERAKSTFPNLRIATFTSQFEDAYIAERGGQVGEAARRLYDVALMTVERMKRNGQAADQDVLLIRNDGDGLGMDKHYLRRMLAAANQKPQADAFTGVVRWDTNTHASYPGFGVVTTFREIMHAVTALQEVSTPVMTVGINSAVRASALAAVGCIGRGNYIGVGSDDREMGLRIIEGRRQSRVRSIAAVAVEHTTSPIAYVPGAGIDTAAERLLNTYRAGLPITRAWDTFDSGGHTDRRAGANVDQLITLESLDTMDAIAKRVENNINAMINIWFTDPRHIKLGLAFTFPVCDELHVPMYSLDSKGVKTTFTLTTAGKTWLANKLGLSEPGQPAVYGDQMIHRLYQGSTKKSTSARFVRRLES